MNARRKVIFQIRDQGIKVSVTCSSASKYRVIIFPRLIVSKRFPERLYNKRFPKGALTLLWKHHRRVYLKLKTYLTLANIPMKD